MKPSKILKLQHRNLSQESFKRFIRQRIKEGSPIALGWYQRKGYSAEWLKK